MFDVCVVRRIHVIQKHHQKYMREFMIVLCGYLYTENCPVGCKSETVIIYLLTVQAGHSSHWLHAVLVRYGVDAMVAVLHVHGPTH